MIFKRIIKKIKDFFASFNKTKEIMKPRIGYVSTLVLGTVSETLFNCPIDCHEIGVSKYRLRRSFSSVMRERINETSNAITLIKVDCHNDKNNMSKTVKVRHDFFFIGTDDNLYQLQIVTYCKAMTVLNDYDQDIINACNMLTHGIIEANDFDSISKSNIIVPDVRSIDIINQKSYDGYVTTYGNSDEFKEVGSNRINLNKNEVNPLDEELELVYGFFNEDEDDEMIVDIIRKHRKEES